MAKDEDDLNAPARQDDSAAAHEAPSGGVSSLGDERFAENVRATREDRGMSQADLARKMSDRGWPYYAQTVHRVETGRRKVSVGEGEALASVLKTTLTWLLKPAPESRAATLLSRERFKAHDAFEHITQATTELLDAQDELRQLTANLDREGLIKSSALVSHQAERAAEEIAKEPEAAVRQGRERHDKRKAEADAQPVRYGRTVLPQRFPRAEPPGAGPAGAGD